MKYFYLEVNEYVFKVNLGNYVEISMLVPNFEVSNLKFENHTFRRIK
jgi:hypothetical protein